MENLKEKKISYKKSWVLFLFLIFGIIIFVSFINNSKSSTTNNSEVAGSLKCPKQGMFQSDWEYCVELCLLDKKKGASSRICEQICDADAYLDGTYGYEFITKRIKKYKCEKCGEDCTEELLEQMEMKKKIDEEKQAKYEEDERIYLIQEECRNKCYDEASNEIGENECFVDKENKVTTPRCEELLDRCFKLRECDNLDGSEEQLKAIEEKIERLKKEQLLKEQERIELEKNIESQSEKLNGYIYIKNISGEPRQFKENGIIYDFPFPAEHPTKVTEDVGRRLLTTGNFELVIFLN
jgi:hypothetical protein